MFSNPPLPQSGINFNFKFSSLGLNVMINLQRKVMFLNLHLHASAGDVEGVDIQKEIARYLNEMFRYAQRNHVCLPSWG